MVWYMGDMRYKRTLKHQGLRLKASGSKTESLASNSSTPSTPEARDIDATTTTRPWEIGVTLIAGDQRHLQSRQQTDTASSSSTSWTSTSVWTYVAPVGKIFRWDVAQKAQVGSMEVDRLEPVGDVSPVRRGHARGDPGEKTGGEKSTSPTKRSQSKTVTSMTVLGGYLYLGRADGVVLVVDALLEPGSTPLISVFRPHEAEIASLVTIGASAVISARKSGSDAEESSHHLAKRTPSYRGVGVDNYVMSKSATGLGGSASSTLSSLGSSTFNPPWWETKPGEGTNCPLLVSIGRGYRSLISSKCPTVAFSPAAVTQSSGANRHKTFVLSFYATEWDRAESLEADGE